MIRTIKICAFSASLTLSLFSPLAIAQQSVMVAGDSISAGFQRPSYRQPLLDALAARGCTVDMVGNQTTNSYSFRNPRALPGSFFPGFSPANGYDTDHQSFGGITAGEFANGVTVGSVTVLPLARYVSREQPDFVLIHLGTNDLSGAVRAGMNTAQAIENWANETTAEVRTAVTRVIGAHSNPADLRVLVANFIPNSNDTFSVTQTLASLEGSRVFTRKLEQMVAGLRNSRVLAPTSRSNISF